MQQEVKSVVMVGAGPSALTAAIYTTREDIDTTLYEKGVVGGLAAITDKVSAIRHEDGVNILTVDGNEVRAKAVLIATGSDYNKLNIPGEAEYYGRGVHYCATCDGAFYRDKRLVVVGGGNSGVQEAIFLTRFASHIDLLVRSTVKASQVLQDDLKKYIDDGKVTIHLETMPTEIVADNTGKVTAVKATKAGEATEFMVDGVFIFIGLKPNTQFLEGSGVELDERRLIRTDDHLATSLPGVFASGDVRSGATMQVASAVGEGATAALSIREYLESQALSK